MVEIQETPMEVDNVISKINEKSTAEKPIRFSTKNLNLPSKSYILTGLESEQIHKENLNVLGSMTDEEIKEEREKIIATMDPAIISYLRSKRKKEAVQNRNPSMEEQNEASVDVIIEEIDTASEILGQPRAEKWLNFDVIEVSKLAWMKNVDISKLKQSGKFEAR